MNVSKLKEVFVINSSDLLSAADKQLALSNVVGIGTRLAFDACLGGNGSTAFKIAAAYAGFLTMAWNFLWKQSLIARLPLAKEYPLLKGAVSPLGSTAAHGVGWGLSCSREKYAAKGGWGLCQVPSVASAAVVGDHSLKKIGVCFKNLFSRPHDTAKGIAVHAFNLGCEVWRVYSGWQNQGVESWCAQKEFFEGRGGLQFAHEISNVGHKVVVEEAASKQALKEYGDRLAENEGSFSSLLRKAQNEASLFQAAQDADLNALLWNRPTSEDLNGEDYFAGEKLFEESVLRMNQAWARGWGDWSKRMMKQAKSERDFKRVRGGCDSVRQVKENMQKLDLVYFSPLELQTGSMEKDCSIDMPLVLVKPPKEVERQKEKPVDRENGMSLLLGVIGILPVVLGILGIVGFTRLRTYQEMERNRGIL